VALFEAVGLHKRFGDRVVLEQIDLAFEAGSLTGIMGPNGAGKTTCFNCLTGMYAPDRGEIRLEGRSIGGLAPAAVTRLGVARSFQTINLFDDDTALDNLVVALPAMRARSFDAWRDRARDGAAQDQAAALLERVGLRGRERVRARDLAYGERRALEIGLALATGPRILFLDEPTSGLGANGTARLAELVRELRRVLTLVIIEHDMTFLFRLADYVNVIHWGQVIARGTPSELRDNPWVQRSALGAIAC
jgi:branched-chain amino acid transport system ATP-binding protein